MTDSEKSAYQYYVSLCLRNDMSPLSFDDWTQLLDGNVPESLIKEGVG